MNTVSVPKEYLAKSDNIVVPQSIYAIPNADVIQSPYRSPTLADDRNDFDANEFPTIDEHKLAIAIVLNVRGGSSGGGRRNGGRSRGMRNVDKDEDTREVQLKKGGDFGLFHQKVEEATPKTEDSSKEDQQS